MKLLVTGASGFLGQYVVAEALRRGHAVRAMVRPGAELSKLGWANESGTLELARVDLRSRKGLVEAVEGVDGVVHLAAAKAGDVYGQYAGSVIATENLLWALEQLPRHRAPRVVHISSFSVYDFDKPRGWSVIDEDAPVERDAMERDGYAHTKLVQERIVREAAGKNGWDLCVVRPGMIYGKGNLWNAFCGLEAGPRLWLRTGTFAKLALTYVENVAEAIVLAAEKKEAAGHTLNVVDDDLPSRRAYVKLLQQNWPAPRPRVVPVPWFVMRELARSAWLTNKLLLGGRAKLPGILVPCRLAARLKPFRFSNARLKRVLGWSPRYDLETAVQRSLADSARSFPPGGGKPDAGFDGTRGGEGGAPPLPPGEGAMRIAYLTGEYPRATDTFIQREIAALRQTGVHVETLSVRVPAHAENVGPEQAAEKRDTFYLLPPRPLDLLRAHASLLADSPARWFGALRLAFKTRPPGLKQLALQFAYFAEAALVARRMRERKLDHLHNHFADSSCSVAMIAAHLGGFPYSFTIHGPAEFFEPRKWRLDEKVRRARFVACISFFCRSQVMCFSDRADWDKLKIVHCGVNPADFTTVHHRGPGRRLLFVGRLAGVKGVPVLLEALAKIRADRPDVVLRIAGDGPERASVEAHAARLGVSQSVQFLGYRTQAEVRALLRETDVFVMASFAEGVPVVLMEAMASGVPVVSTHIAGVPELVADGVSGRLVPPGDAGALAEAVSALLADPDLRGRLGAAGRATVEREFNLATEAARLRHTLAESLAGRGVALRPQPAARPAETLPPAGEVPKFSAEPEPAAVVKCA